MIPFAQALAFAVLSALAMLLLTRPYWRAPRERAPSRRAANVRAYRARIAELEQDAAAGLLDADALAKLREELDRRVLTDAEAAETSPAAARSSRVWLLLFLLPLAAVLGYFTQESWHLQDLVSRAAADPAQAQALAVQRMVEKLSDRLKKAPNDQEGWSMLGRSYFVLQRYRESADAYARASGLAGGQDPDLLVSQGEALAFSQERDLQGQPSALFAQALALAPDQPRALWYAGLAAGQAGDSAHALELWNRLLKQDLPAEIRGQLQQRINELRAASGLAPQKFAAAAAPKVASAAGEGLALHVRVRIAPALAAQIPSGATLFVFAKAAQGPPMPLAVQRLSASALPAEVTLDDSMAMMPSLKLSQFERWTVGARVSTSGTPTGASGDLEGSVDVARAQAGQPVELVIDRVRP